MISRIQTLDGISETQQPDHLRIWTMQNSIPYGEAHAKGLSETADTGIDSGLEWFIMANANIQSQEIRPGHGFGQFSQHIAACMYRFA
jgi:hypothetical protein